MTAKKSGGSSKAPKFPTQELNKWLREHKAWEHADWLNLLAELRQSGYGHLVDNAEGQSSIGKYLEANRPKG
jgi:hypothetical protein